VPRGEGTCVKSTRGTGVGCDCCARCAWVLEGFDRWELWIGRYAELRRESVIFGGCVESVIWGCVDGKIAWMNTSDKDG
jgi:hypothetical protein